VLVAESTAEDDLPRAADLDTTAACRKQTDRCPVTKSPWVTFCCNTAHGIFSTEGNRFTAQESFLRRQPCY
jgi:hypothetical protein